MYDIPFLILFSAFVAWFLYTRRANLKKEGIMYLYPTKVGVKFIDYVGSKYKKTLRVFAFLSVISGYFLMAIMMYMLWKLIYVYLFAPEIVRAIKIPPLMPLVPYLPEVFKIDFLPSFYFTYWIIAIAVIAIFHEFAHGIIAKSYGIKIKATGFGFLGPFLAAFVEPDEKQMESKSKYQQIAVLSAGTFTNLILAILFFILLALFFTIAFIPSGALFNTYAVKVVDINSISNIGGIETTNPTKGTIIDLIETNNLQDTFELGSNGDTLKLTKITANGQTYYMELEALKNQLALDTSEVALYIDTSAIRNSLRGTIVKIDNFEIKDHEDVSTTLQNYNPGDTLTITTKDKKETLNYELKVH